MRTYLIAATILIVAGACSKPAEKYAECNERCTIMKSSFGKRICRSSCERSVYGEFDQEKLTDLCKDGDSTACIRFAARALPGEGPAVDALLQARCDAKDGECCGVLGKIYKKGKLVKKDKPKGYKLMEQGCRLGASFACASPTLKYMGKRDYKPALELASAGCTGGAKWSCGLLGVLYRDGKGVTRDVGKAKKFFSKACNQGVKMSCKALRRLRRL